MILRSGDTVTASYEYDGDVLKGMIQVDTESGDTLFYSLDDEGCLKVVDTEVKSGAKRGCKPKGG
jgi:hypothetical protein